jgi:threonylcarbamoyladenosine tRNA methylthiotransferase MtaB
MPSVFVHTLGCKLNQLESESIIDAFIQAGFALHLASDKTSPSIIIINSCTVTSKADQKARRVIRKSLRDCPDSCVLVTGCYALLDHALLDELDANPRKRLFTLKGMEKEKLLRLPEFIYMNTDIREAVKAWLENGTGNVETDVFKFSPERFSSHTRGFIKIQDGCDKRCTYCRIRLARGPSVSLDAERALARLRILEENHSEAVLTGVNICQYHDENYAMNFPRLLEYLLAGTSKINLRLPTLAPECINEDFAAVLSNRRIRPHFHLSVQSGSGVVLERMGRDYNAQTIEKAVTLLRCVKDDPFLACDIISGFPGENIDDFDETYDICNKMDFAWIHVFPYSKRPGTPAWSFSGAVQEKEVSRRTILLTNLAKRGKAGYVKRWLGREADVLIENGGGKYCRGVSDNYLKLVIHCKEGNIPPPGAVLRCRLLEKHHAAKIDDYDAVAETLGLYQS